MTRTTLSRGCRGSLLLGSLVAWLLLPVILGQNLGHIEATSPAHWVWLEAEEFAVSNFPYASVSTRGIFCSSCSGGEYLLSQPGKRGRPFAPPGYWYTDYAVRVSEPGNYRRVWLALSPADVAFSWSVDGQPFIAAATVETAPAYGSPAFRWVRLDPAGLNLNLTPGGNPHTLSLRRDDPEQPRLRMDAVVLTTDETWTPSGVEKPPVDRSYLEPYPDYVLYTRSWLEHIFDEPGYTAGDTKPITLTGLTGAAVTVTPVVPAADTGQEVTDYATAFAVSTYRVSDGVATIVLGEDPVLVEEGEQPPPSILASIVMHNEEPAPGKYPDFVNDEPAFWQHRTALVQFVDMLHANGVMFNYQSDWNFLMAAGLYDTGTPETNGKNVIRYIKENLGFEVDPHAHETRYNYADVAYLIEALGVAPSHTVGGFQAAPPEESKLEYLWHPITGAQYPSNTWRAEILWGGATLFHVNEESLWASGVWKPKDKYHFLEHDDDAPLPHVGGYGRNCDRLIQKQQAGELEDGKIHTCTIFVGQSRLLLPGFVQQFEQRIQDSDAAGDIRWVGLAEVINIWQTEYDSEPNVVPFLTPPPTPQPRAYMPLVVKGYRLPVA